MTDMAVSFGIVLGPWNHATDAGELLERAAGEVGLDHVTAPAVSGPQIQWRLDERCEAPLFETEGGWHFPPAGKLYATAGIRPVRAGWVRSADALGPLCEHADRLGLRIVLRVDVFAVGALIEQHAPLSRRNAWGQDVPSSGVCPCNPSARELLRAALEDLCRYGPAAFELAGGLPDRPTAGPPAEVLAWHPAARGLADVCFCAACRQIAERADVDPESAARSVRVQLGRLAATAPDAALSDDDPVLSAYRAARAADCAAWLCRLAGADAERHYFLLRAADDSTPSEPRPLNEVLRWPAPHDEAVHALLAEARRLQVSGCSMPVWRPTFSDAAELVRWVSEATELGVRWFDFEGLDAAPPEAVTWLKQAVRYARRGS